MTYQHPIISFWSFVLRQLFGTAMYITAVASFGAQQHPENSNLFFIAMGISLLIAMLPFANAFDKTTPAISRMHVRCYIPIYGIMQYYQPSRPLINDYAKDEVDRLRLLLLTSMHEIDWESCKHIIHQLIRINIEYLFNVFDLMSDIIHEHAQRKLLCQARRIFAERVLVAELPALPAETKEVFDELSSQFVRETALLQHNLTRHAFLVEFCNEFLEVTIPMRKDAHLSETFPHYFAQVYQHTAALINERTTYVTTKP